MKTIHHVFAIAAPRDDVYSALTTADGLASWWSTRVTATTDTIEFTFGGDFNPVMRVAEPAAPAAVRWECVGGHEPWAGNEFSFELEDTGAGTRLRFWQHYARELSDDAYGTYNFNWGYYLESLRLLCEAGAGKPFGRDTDGAQA